MQDICISCKFNGIDIYTPADGYDFEDMAAKLDFSDAKPKRILIAGDYIFCLPKDNPCFDRK